MGSGIKAISQITLETRQAIEDADKVLVLVADSVTELWIKKIHPHAEILTDSYGIDKPRIITYREIAERTLRYVRDGLKVCVVYDGHPGILVWSSYESINMARSEGFDARMLPGISAEDCLFADLGIRVHGWQCFEATHFLLRIRKFDISTPLILWQIGAIGDLRWHPKKDIKPGITILVDFLKKYYPPNHTVVVYEAAQYRSRKPIIQHFPLCKLADGEVGLGSTLYVPPVASRPMDYSMAYKMGLRSELKPTTIHFSIRRLFRLKSK